MQSKILFPIAPRSLPAHDTRAGEEQSSLSNSQVSGAALVSLWLEEGAIHTGLRGARRRSSSRLRPCQAAKGAESKAPVHNESLCYCPTRLASTTRERRNVRTRHPGSSVPIRRREGSGRLRRPTALEDRSGLPPRCRTKFRHTSPSTTATHCLPYRTSHSHWRQRTPPDWCRAEPRHCNSDENLALD
jgi:hypothetical protein